MCARFQTWHRESNVKVLKRILKYLNGTSNHGLWFPKGSECISLVFSDSDFTGCKSDWKCTSCTYHIFGNCLVSRHSKKQHNVEFFTVDAKYVTTDNFYTQILWIQKILDYNLKLDCIPIKRITLVL